jgi:hypothetical protein
MEAARNSQNQKVDIQGDHNTTFLKVLLQPPGVLFFDFENYPCSVEEQSTMLLHCTSEIHRFRIPNLDLDKSHQLWGLVYLP